MTIRQHRLAPDQQSVDDFLTALDLDARRSLCAREARVLIMTHLVLLVAPVAIKALPPVRFLE
jgi:hypothetical protein